MTRQRMFLDMSCVDAARERIRHVYDTNYERRDTRHSISSRPFLLELQDKQNGKMLPIQFAPPRLSGITCSTVSDDGRSPQ